MYMFTLNIAEFQCSLLLQIMTVFGFNCCQCYVHNKHRPVYIESRVCVVKEAVMCSFDYWYVVYRTLSLTNYFALNKRLK